MFPDLAQGTGWDKVGVASCFTCRQTMLSSSTVTGGRRLETGTRVVGRTADTVQFTAFEVYRRFDISEEDSCENL